MTSHAERGIVRRYAYGDALTAADLFLVPQVYNARHYDVDLTPYPRLVAAADPAAATDAGRAAAPEQQPDAPPPTARATP
jgi:glutathione S-transferase